MAANPNTQQPEQVAQNEQAEKDIQVYQNAGIPANNEDSIIFEQLRRNYTNRSVVKNIDTAFKYFSFPPSTTLNMSDFALPDFNININDFGTDPVSGFYKILPEAEGDYGANEYKKINLSYQSSWNVDTGNPTGQAGHRSLPFSQPLSGPALADAPMFVFTPDIIKLLVESNRTIKFTVRITVNQQKADVAGPNDLNGDPARRNVGYDLRLKRHMPTAWRDNGKIGADGNYIYRNSTGVRAYITSETHRANTGHTGDNSDMWPNLEIQYIVDPRAIADYDGWMVQCAAGGASWYLRSVCWWKIELIDDPGFGISSDIVRSRKYGKQTNVPSTRDQLLDV